MRVTQTKTVEEITERLIDYRGKTPPKTESGIKLITAKVIKDGFIQDDANEYISEETYATWMTRGFPRQGDILITTEAPLGEVARLQTTEKIALAQRIILLRGRPDEIDQAYYFYALKSPFVQAELRSRSSGTTVLGIKQSELRRIRIPWRQLAAQCKIGAVLSTYDGLIENNGRRIEILGEMIRRTYEEWFEELRFPGAKTEMTKGTRGHVPTGWSRGRFRDLASIARDTLNPQQHPEEEFAHFSIPAFDSGRLPVREKGIDIKSNKYLISTGTVLLSKLNPRIPRVWLPRVPSDARAISSTEFLALAPTKLATAAFLYSVCSSRQFGDRFAGRAIGTSTSHQRVKPEDFLELPMTIPSEDIIREFTKIAQPLLDLEFDLRRKNVNLYRSRDLLLPKLISGDLDVSDLDIPTEAIV